MNTHVIFNDTFVVPSCQDFKDAKHEFNSVFKKCIDCPINSKCKIIFSYGAHRSTPYTFGAYVSCIDYKFTNFVKNPNKKFIIIFNLFHSTGLVSSYKLRWDAFMFNNQGEPAVGNDLKINVVKEGGYMLNIELHCITDDDKDVEYLKELFKMKE